MCGVCPRLGGSWLLQGRCTSPSFNGAAVKYFLLSSSLLFSSSMVSNKDRNDGRCRSLWRQLAAAGPSGGRFWPLQVSLAAIGCCKAMWRQLAAAGPLQGRCTRPSFNGAAALKCFFLSSSFLFSSCLVLNKNKNDTELQFSNCILIRWCC